MDTYAVLTTGYGVWSPLLWLLAFVIALIIGWFIWLRGEAGFRGGSAQTAPYLSGNPEPSKGAVHIRAGNLYWGFMEGIRGYYDRLVPLHTGIMTDYILWMIWVTAILLIVMVVV